MVAGIVFSSLSVLVPYGDQQPIFYPSFGISHLSGTTVRSPDVVLKDSTCGPSLAVR